MSKIISYSTALKQIQELFSNTSKDSITALEAYEAGKRPLDTPKRNKVWLRDRLTDLKKYELVEPTYIIQKGQKKLDRICLTAKGKQALKETKNDVENTKPSLLPLPEKVKQEVTNVKNNASTIEVAVQLMTKLSQENPNRKVTYDIKGGTISIYNK